MKGIVKFWVHSRKGMCTKILYINDKKKKLTKNVLEFLFTVMAVEKILNT